MVRALLKMQHKRLPLMAGAFVATFILAGICFATRPVSASPQSAALAQAETTVLAVVSSTGSNVVDKPEGTTVTKLDPGAVVTAFGRSSDSTWIAIRTEDKKVGWMKASDVVIYSIETLAVIDPTTDLPGASQAPTATATPVPPTPTKAPTPSPTPKPTLPPTATATPVQSEVVTSTTTSAQGTSEQPSINLPTTGLLGVVGGGGAEVQDKPDGKTILQLDSASTISLVGRNEASDWLLVVTENGTQGWVKSENVVAFDLDTLPVTDATGTAAPQAEVAAAATTVTTTTVEAASSEVTTTTTASAIEPAAAPVAETTDASVQVTVQTEGARLRVRSGPGTSYSISGAVANGASYPAIGRNVDSSWVQVTLEDGSKGWLSATYLSASGTLSSLPVVQASAAPAATPTSKATPVSSSNAAASTASTQSAKTTQTAAPTGLSGKIVVSSGGGGMFYVYDLATGTLRPVTGGYDPAISLDGTKIAFARMGGENGIYVINIDGSDERKVFGESELLASPKWNADGSKITFAHLANANSTSVTCRTPGFGICLPDEEPFEDLPLRTITKSNNSYGLGRVTVADKEFRDLPAEGSVDAPDWDNDNIIYRANRGFKITADKPTVDIKTVTEDPGFQDPDLYGNRIVYQSKSGNHWEIMVMNDDGSGQTYLTRPVTTLVDALPNNVAPAWSPDGKYIVFLSNRSPNNEAGDWHVWVMNADGSNQRQLPIDVKISYGYAQEQMVSWGK
ncbi:MAG: SH3 domain-containing protein [Caldilineaceae bacterium]